MLYFHQKGNPKDILRAINPSEAFLIDGASNIHIRFRLGGEKFPPLIYYKIYTHGGICDINSYAPRDYTMVRKVTMKETVDMEFESEEAKNVTDGWYERYDNNGWRPITDNILAPFDAVELRTASKPVVYHYSKLKRREMVAMEKRKRKINWLKKLYSDAKKTEEAELMEKLNEGQAGEDITIENIGSIDNYEGEDDLSDRMGNTARTLEKLLAADDNPFNDEKLLEMDPNQFEEHVNDLIEWSETLDYDKYVLEWNLIGTTAGHLQTVPDYEY